MEGSGSVRVSRSHCLYLAEIRQGRNLHRLTAYATIRIDTSPRLGKVEAIEIHDLVPCSHEVMHEAFLRVITRVDFSDGSELGI